jgi:MFS family permease
MYFSLLSLIIRVISLIQIKWPWENQKPIEELFQGPSLILWVFAWILLGLGIVSLIILVLYTKYGRKISIKLSAITILTASISLGLSFHFFLIHFGF